MADLHPIVIPHIEHTFKSIKYTCAGEGIYKDGYLYDPHPEKFFPPKTTKAGAEPKEVEKKPVAYWKAQCAFRGLNQSGATSDLQLRLREAKKKILPELKAAETRLNKEFKNMNKAARDGAWNKMTSVEQKAKANPQKFLAETFPKGATGRPANMDIIVLKIGTDDRLKVANAADDMGLETVSVDAPRTGAKKPSPDRWIVIGRSRDAVWNQMREIERQSSRSNEEHSSEKSKAQTPKQITAKEKAKPNPSQPKSATPSGSKQTSKAQPSQKTAPQPKSAAPISVEPPPKLKAWQTKQTARKSAFPNRGKEPMRMYSEEGPPPKLKAWRTKQTARKSTYPDRDEELLEKYPEPPSSTGSKMSENAWDIRGSYVVRCPEIEQQWDPQGDPTLTLDLYLETRNGRQQMYGMFHFRIVEGIMRFEKPVPVPRTKTAGGESSTKRKREDDDQDEDLPLDFYPPYNEDDDRSGPYEEKDFFLGAKDKPTARRPTWSYRWRGTETGEGEIQIGSDMAVRSITFSKKGTELSGSFNCEYVGDCHFTGVKVQSRPHDGQVDPEAEWTNCSEAAHEYARRARWGGGGGW